MFDVFYDITDIYIAKIYSINNFDSGKISDKYAAFYREYNEETKEYDYILLNRGALNRDTMMFKRYSVFQSLDTIDICLDFSFFYVDDIRPITKKIKGNPKKFVHLLDIHNYLYEINQYEQEKQKTKRK